MPQISIITPVYIDDPDKLVWLSEMIESLQSQTVADWECVLIDDCSPLLLGEVKLKFQDDNRLRWLRNAQRYGPAMTRNSAVAVAKSEVLLPVDADDMLSNPQVLERMHAAWQQDQTRTIYGDLQVLEIENGHWKTRKITQLAEYSFENAMNLNGVMPVSAMHSKTVWLAAGGWKPILQYGREDVEYWIASGKAGHCGRKINHTTLLYRKHELSRDYRLKYIEDKTDEMGDLIRQMHNDVYGGEYPMGCCDRDNTQQQVNKSSKVNSKITTLDEFPDSQKVWIEYTGSNKASFSIHGRATRTNYRVQGPGHMFQAHIDDAQIFKSMSQGGQQYIVGVPAPRIETDEPEPIQPLAGYNGGEPQLATLERLDTDPVVVESTPIEHQPLTDIGHHPSSQLVDSNIQEIVSSTSMWNLGELDIGKFAQVLEVENWTIEKLAEANPDELMTYPDIGPVRANQIVESAKKWLGQKQ